jgi:hypothetical protein
MYQNQNTQQIMVHPTAPRQVSARLRPKAGPRGNPHGQSPAIAPVFSRPAFLSRSFLPLLDKAYPELKAFAKIEKQIGISLANLCNLYGLVTPDLNGVFPQNISLALNGLRKGLQEIDRDLELRLMQCEGVPSKNCLCTRKTFDTGMTLYYLPLAPLWEVMKTASRKQESDLLLSVCAYLFQIAGVPHFAERFVYLNSIYETVEQWNDEDECEDLDGEERKAISSYFGQMWEAGEALLLELRDKAHLFGFKKRFRAFKPKDQAGETLRNCAKKAMKLYSDFPFRSIMENMAMPILDSNGDNFIRAEHYISFYWSNNDCVIDSVMECVNNELNELCEMEEPASYQFFDTPQTAQTHDHQFERRFFELLNELTDILNELRP